MSTRPRHFETLSVHAGYSPDPTTKAVAVPLFQTVAYAFDSAQHGADLFDLKVPGNIYTRIMNPTTAVLEQRVAAMEGGVGALAVSAGSAAITYALMTIAEVGDNIVTTSTLYGGTYNLFAHTLPRFGIEARFADYRDVEAMGRLIDGKTKAVFCESIGQERHRASRRDSSRDTCERDAELLVDWDRASQAQGQTQSLGTRPCLLFAT